MQLGKCVASHSSVSQSLGYQAISGLFRDVWVNIKSHQDGQWEKLSRGGKCLQGKQMERNRLVQWFHKKDTDSSSTHSLSSDHSLTELSANSLYHGDECMRRMGHTSCLAWVVLAYTCCASENSSLRKCRRCTNDWRWQISKVQENKRNG